MSRRVAGEDHVGIGTDNGVMPLGYDAEAHEGLGRLARANGSRRGSPRRAKRRAIYPWIADANSLDRYRRVADALAKRGWSQARLEKLMGGNFLRVYRDAWGG